jgi:flagellar hook-associated protein 2
MSSATSPLLSLLSSSSSSLPSSTATFNGTSQYAGDLQQEINQAVAIASIPMTELQSNVSTLQSESGEVTTLQNDFTSIQTAIQDLANGSGALSGTSSDSSVASVSVDSSAALASGTYTLDVISAGSPTSAISAAGLPNVADPSTSSISTSNTFTLTVDGSNYTITPASNTLNALAEAINSSNLGVTATVVNIGPPSAPDYRLTLQSTSLGDENIQLNDGSQNLLTVLAAGTSAQYTVDGQPASPADPISSNSSTVTLAPGVTVDLLQAGQTTVTVAPDSSSSANALSAFATAYNQAVSDLNTNHGTSGGALTGQSIVMELQQSLQGLLQYAGGSGSVTSLADLGLTFNSTGQLSFDQSTFENVASTDPTDLSNFLGSATSGGFLQSATNLLNGLENPNNGIFASTNNSYEQQITEDNTQITDMQTRITNMQNTLTAQMTTADTLIASLESQVSYYTTLFQDTNDAIQNGG